MDIEQVAVFYNSINVDIITVKNFYTKLKKICKCLKPVDITNRREVSLFLEAMKKMKNIKNIFLINLGGDGSLFSSLSILAKTLETQKIHTISFNFGNKGFYCFYPKNLLFDFLEDKINIMDIIKNDYEEENFVEGYFWLANEEPFIGDVVIKPYNQYKTIRLSYRIEDKEIEEICDGIIVFTTFGATGYFLSLNGVYIDNGFKDLIGLSFIAPHSLKHRPHLLKNKKISITNKDKKTAIVINDGQDKFLLESNKTIEISRFDKEFILIGQKNTFKRWVEIFYDK